MSVLRSCRIAAIGSALAVAIAASPASATAVDPPQPGSRTLVIPWCTSKPRYEPTLFLFDCATGRRALDHIAYFSWTATTATGHGRFTVCCHAGMTPVDEPGIRFTIDRVKAVNGQRLFTHLTMYRAGRVYESDDLPTGTRPD